MKASLLKYFEGGIGYKDIENMSNADILNWNELAHKVQKEIDKNNKVK